MKYFICLASLALISACGPASTNPNTALTPSDSNAFTVSFSEVSQILEQRCQRCHSRQGGRVEEGVSLDSPEEIKSNLSAIKRNAVLNTYMPPTNNVTEMTDAERELIGQWIAQGAQVDQ